MKFYVMKKVSKAGNDYFCLSADLGYRILNLTFDLTTISEISGMSIQEIYGLKVGDQILIGELVRKGGK